MTEKHRPGEHPTTWTLKAIQTLFDTPFFDLLSQAHHVHRTHFDLNAIEMCALINIKTGGCPEDCGFCTQSAHFKTDLTRAPLLTCEIVRHKAAALKETGVTRICLGAAWRRPPKKDFPRVLEMIAEIKALGFETCVTLGFLEEAEAVALKNAGLDYYNHNIETSPTFYPSLVSTHTFEDRLTTVTRVAHAGLNVCCGGIVGLGETRADRAAFLFALTTLPTAPQSIPINRMIPFEGTPLAQVPTLDKVEFIKTIAVTRLLFPTARIRLSGGRKELSEADHILCFYAGANSLFVGDTLLTAANASFATDKDLLARLDMLPPQALS